MAFTLPDLNYSYDALERSIDARTMEIHYSKHHAGYTNNLNAAIDGTPLADKSIEDILANVSSESAAVRNNGGGYFNHNLFWTILGPDGGGTPGGDIGAAIDANFGSFDTFKDTFSKAAATRFGSGWAWLIKQGDKLVVSSTPNQDNPIMDIADVKGTPILAIDVWEHAYYLRYQNRRPDYIAAFWDVVNWNEVEKRLKA
jgi:Fe-Mn family superoxide dismutase